MKKFNKIVNEETAHKIGNVVCKGVQVASVMVMYGLYLKVFTTSYDCGGFTFKMEPNRFERQPHTYHDYQETYIENPQYDDAVRAIVSMGDYSDYYKDKCIKILKRGETSDYYGAVINIAHSGMSDYYKYRSIRELSK